MNVGNEGFSEGKAIFIDLAINPSGEPYISYTDYGNFQAATVMKFNGTNWVNVGIAGFSETVALYSSLTFNLTGQPYVAYMDFGNAGKATLKKFDGTNWLNVGNAGFSAGEAYYTDLAFSQSGEPYVAYEDGENFQAATVMKYDSVYVGMNELQKSGLSIYPNPTTDKLTIETSGASKGHYLIVVNIEGQELIKKQVADHKTQVDISTFPSGIYFVKMTGEKRVQVGKFIKQ